MPNVMGTYQLAALVLQTLPKSAKFAAVIRSLIVLLVLLMVYLVKLAIRVIF